MHLILTSGPKMVAVRNYHGTPVPPGKTPLSFQTGDFIELLKGEPDTTWWEGKLIQTQKSGFFPNNCVKPCLDPKPLFQSFPSRQPSRETDYYGYPWYDPSPWIHHTCPHFEMMIQCSLKVLSSYFSAVNKLYYCGIMLGQCITMLRQCITTLRQCFTLLRQCITLLDNVLILYYYVKTVYYYVKTGYYYVKTGYYYVKTVYYYVKTVYYTMLRQDITMLRQCITMLRQDITMLGRCITMLGRCITQCPVRFAGNMERTQADNLLKSHSSGTYLIRERTAEAERFAISIK
ncbi:unnamed protein product [Oncorhynchus mykiss]|uniref:SH3 domain-containing protein n=1 Tax=Oncorhynchus mykiss TaxID=8022 RepID=A0A060Y0T5_ONCMY|nr:unnamed protein product [Oncorhynchus mykiss]